jgi:antitoxin (DNA-binding transcriptional repressor) of toxin-antitoxin stability system
MTGQVYIDIEIAAAILENLLDALANGEMISIILTKEGQPSAKLVPPSSG